MKTQRHNDTTTVEAISDLRSQISDLAYLNRRSEIRDQRCKGFTIAEMLIVTIIMAILFSIGARTYYDEKERFQFNNAFIEMIQIIKGARNLATTSASIYIPTLPAGQQDVIPTDGYGIYINLDPENVANPQAAASPDNPHMILFANKGDGIENTKDSFQNDDEPNRFDGNDEIIETYRLPKLVQFFSFDFDFSNDEPDMGMQEQYDYDEDTDAPTALEASIIFRPPLADAYLGNNNSTNPKELEELSLNFINPTSNNDSVKKCLYIRFNRVRSFAELLYGAMDETGKCIRPS